MLKELLQQSDEPTRRAFMNYAAGAFLGVHLWPRAEAAAPKTGGKAKSVIYLYMSGGMSHLDTFDTKPGAENQGPTETIKTNAKGVQLSGYLPNLAKHGDKLAIVRSLSSTQGAHERGNYFMHTSYTQRGTIQHPALGAWALKFKGKINKTLPGNVLIDGGSRHPGAGFFETRLAPVPIGNPEAGLQNSRLPRGVTEQQMNKRLKLSDKFDHAFRDRYDHKKVRAYTDLYEDAVRLMKSEDLAAFDIKQEPDDVRAAYNVPASDDNNRRNRGGGFGQGVLLARRLVEHGVRFVEVNLGGWDTHTENWERVPERAAQLDHALAALLNDLKSKGLLDSTLVVVATEFGRTPKINDREGRDHYPKAFCGVLAGGGIRGGQVYGKTDSQGAEVVEHKVSVPDFNATIAHAMGLPLNEIVYSPSKRPFQVANREGKPLLDLF